MHGGCTGAWIWAPFFLPYFAAAGFHCYALSLRGHGGSPGMLDLATLQDFASDIAAAVERIGAPPVLLAHSLGGLVSLKYLERGRAHRLALVAPVPPQGLGPVMSTFPIRDPFVFIELTRLMLVGRISHDALRRAFFAGQVDMDRVEWCRQLVQRESQRAIWDALLFDLPRPAHRNLPTLVLAGERDVVIPPQLVAMYGEPVHVIPGAGHAMMLESEWQLTADRVIRWLNG